jgi:membrane protease YdiL (CAAX protease family)
MLTFFVLTFALAWTLWAVAALVPLSGPARALIFLPGTFAPGLVALAMSAVHGGAQGAGALVGRIFRWDVGARWYVFALSFMAGVKLSAAVLHWGLYGAWPAFTTAPIAALFASAVLSTPFQAGEELGWRGYVLPRMAARLGLGPSSVLLGVIWAAWHLPLFYIADTTTTGQPFPVYLVSVTALSVVMAWLFARTGGSLLPVMLLHAGVNNTTAIVPGAVAVAGNPLALAATPVAWLTAGVLWLAGALLLWRMRGARSELRLGVP